MDLKYTCIECGGRHEMLEPCDKRPKDKWKDTAKGEFPEDNSAVVTKTDGEEKEALYLGIYSRGYKDRFMATWNIDGEDVRNNEVEWKYR